MHGPRVSVKGALRKTYWVSLIDDASRLIAHSAFCLGETALDIERVLKQALRRRGVPLKSGASQTWMTSTRGGGPGSSRSTTAPRTAAWAG